MEFSGEFIPSQKPCEANALAQPILQICVISSGKKSWSKEAV